MAVSMNAGFMRSDYMISDAAIPMRMEELEQLEQSAKFSEILGGIGGSKPMDAEPMKADTQQISEVDTDDAAVQTVESTDSIQLTGTQPEKQTVMITKSELKQLAEAVIKGEIKLNDLPKELVSEVLLMAIAMMLMGIPEDEIPVLQEDHTFSVTEAEAQAMSQYVSLIVVPKMSGETAEQQVQMMSVETADTVRTDAKVQTEADIQLPDELMAEVRAVMRRITLAADDTEELKQVVNTTKAEVSVMSEPELMAQDMAETAVQTEAAVQMAEQAVQADTAVKPVSAQAVTNEAPTKAADAGRKLFAEGKAVKQADVSEEFAGIRKIMSDVTVKTTEPEQTTVQQSFSAQPMAADNAVKGRVVSKSDELQLLKNAVQPQEMTVQAAQGEQKSENGGRMSFGSDVAQDMSGMMQTVQQDDAPVVFVRDDGTQVEVRPSEVIEQVTTKIVEQTTTAEGDTEYSVTLTPEDLGTITVKLTKAADGALSVSIAADNARTQRILEESGLALQQSLKQSGIELESWQTVNESQQETRAQDYNGSAKNPYHSEENENDNGDADDNSFAELISAM